MKFACGRSSRLREERKQAAYKASLEWHKFFAIWPRKVGFEDCRWLETVERRGVLKEQWDYVDLVGFHKSMVRVWEYRPLSKES